MPILQVDPNRPLSPTVLTLIRTLDEVAAQLRISYFVIGATARDILIEHVHGLETTRATRDVDFAVAVASWEEFARLKTTLVETGMFRSGEHLHRLTFGNGSGAYPLDLVSFDGVARNGEIAWPPKGDFVMNVAGYADAHHSALDVEITPGLTVKVVSLPAMTGSTMPKTSTCLRNMATMWSWLGRLSSAVMPDVTSLQKPGPKSWMCLQREGLPTNTLAR